MDHGSIKSPAGDFPKVSRRNLFTESKGFARGSLKRVPQKGELGAEPGFVALQLNGLTLTARGMGSEVLPRRARGSEFAGRARGTERSRLVSELARAVVSAEVSNYYNCIESVEGFGMAFLGDQVASS